MIVVYILSCGVACGVAVGIPIAVYQFFNPGHRFIEKKELELKILEEKNSHVLKLIGS